jgi:hypothetical protein
MNNILTQKEKVVDELLENKSVNNFWAIHNYILRLGAVIHSLKKDHWIFDGHFGEGADKKNFFYDVIQQGRLVMSSPKGRGAGKQPEQSEGQGRLL